MRTTVATACPGCSTRLELELELGHGRHTVRSLCPRCGRKLELVLELNPVRARRAQTPAKRPRGATVKPAPSHATRPPVVQVPPAARLPPLTPENLLVVAQDPTLPRFGSNKVFLGPLLAHFGTTPQREAAKLAEWHRVSRIVLSRADLVQGMPPELVRSSEFSPPAFPSITYHFLFLDPAGNELRERVLAAALQIAPRKNRVRLSQLRRLLGDVPRATLDRELLALQDAGKLVLMRLDNNAEITADDRAAELSIAGAPRHILYVE